MTIEWYTTGLVMSDVGRPLPPETTASMFSQWRAVFKRKECASIILLPRSDRHYRVAQFLSESTLDTPREIHWVSLSLQSLMSEEWGAVRKKLDRIKGGQRTAFLVLDGEWLLTAAPHLVPLLQEYVLHPYRGSSFIFFFEKNILRAEYNQLLSAAPSLFQNIFYQSLYNTSEIEYFIRHLEHLYNHTLTDAQRQKIVHQCGGYIWLTTEAVRFVHAHNGLSFHHEAMLFRLRAIWEGFISDEKQLLKDIVFERPIPTNVSLQQFLAQGLIVQIDNRYRLSVPVITTFIRNTYAAEQQLVKEPNGAITLNNVNVTNFFSDRERRLLDYFLSHQGELITRDAAATILWGKESSYSDWSLDQALRRLRIRLAKLGIRSRLIETVKGKGFIFRGVDR